MQQCLSWSSGYLATHCTADESVLFGNSSGIPGEHIGYAVRQTKSPRRTERTYWRSAFLPELQALQILTRFWALRGRCALAFNEDEDESHWQVVRESWLCVCLCGVWQLCRRRNYNLLASRCPRGRQQWRSLPSVADLALTRTREWHKAYTSIMFFFIALLYASKKRALVRLTLDHACKHATHTFRSHAFRILQFVVVVTHCLFFLMPKHLLLLCTFSPPCWFVRRFTPLMTFPRKSTRISFCGPANWAVSLHAASYRCSIAHSDQVLSLIPTTPLLLPCSYTRFDGVARVSDIAPIAYAFLDLVTLPLGVPLVSLPVE